MVYVTISHIPPKWKDMPIVVIQKLSRYAQENFSEERIIEKAVKLGDSNE